MLTPTFQMLNQFLYGYLYPILFFLFSYDSGNHDIPRRWETHMNVRDSLHKRHFI